MSATANNDCYAPLTGILTKEQTCLAGLKEALAEEHCALKERDITALQSIIARKQKAVEEELTLSAERGTLLEQHGFSNDHAGMDSCIEKSSDTLRDSLKKQWEQLTTLLDECHTQNQVNGQILAINQDILKTINAILTYEPDKVELYNANGTTKAGQASTQTIAKA